jgi:hypothetical protein
LHNRIVEGLSVRKFEKKYYFSGKLPEDLKEVVITGRQCFEYIYADFEKIFKDEIQKSNDEPMIWSNIIENSIWYLFMQYESELGHYSKYLLHVFKFVDQSGLKSKKRYTNIVRAQLSAFELRLLFFICLSSYGVKDFKLIIEKYSIFKNLPEDDLFEEYKLYSLYKPSAYNTPQRKVI